MSIFIAIILFATYIICMRFVSSTIEKVGEKKSVNTYRIKYIGKTLNISLTVFFVIVLFLLLGIQYSQLSVFLSSVFAVIGVALFAQWSILSNITSSLIIFFAFPYRVGDVIRIVDKDDDLSGIIEEISLFHVIILRGDALITYPNSLMLQKAVIKVSDLSKLPPHASTLNQLVNNSPANTDKPTEKEASVK
ncbi:Small-conductance mechanosensitive channel [gamma proteobacterium IMCC1989]|nr:Small-conductance mechanosensitive channel [gamma proteobacterium IMCC1989]